MSEQTTVVKTDVVLQPILSRVPGRAKKEAHEAMAVRGVGREADLLGVIRTLQALVDESMVRLDACEAKLTSEQNETARLKKIVQLTAEQYEIFSEASAVTTRLVEQIVKSTHVNKMRWELTGCDSGVRKDGHSVYVRLHFGEWQFDVDIAAGIVTVELIGEMHPRSLSIDAGGFTAEGASDFAGYVTLAKLTDEEREAFNEIQRKQIFVEKPSSAEARP